jgi:hypothetical protein
MSNWVAGLRLAIACLIFAASGPATRADIFAIRTRIAGANDLVRFSPTGQFLGQFPQPTAFAGGLTNLTRGPDGNPYLLFNGDFDLSFIERSNLANGGAFEDVGPPGVMSGSSYGIAFDPRGHLFVNKWYTLAPAGGTAVFEVNSTTTTIISRATDAAYVGNIAFDATGNLYVAVGGVGIRKYAPGRGGAVMLTMPVDFVPRSGEPFAFGPDGMLYAGTRSAGIERFDPATGNSLGTFVPAGAQGVTDPISFVFGDDGTLYVNDRTAQRILKFDAATGAPTGLFADYSGSGQPIFTIAYAVPLPEPATVGLLAVAMVAWTTSRRRRGSRHHIALS